MSKKYYKILTDDLKHNNMQYKLGLNTDINPFKNDGICGNGLFFTDRENLCWFLDYGTKLGIITIPDREVVNDCRNKYKSHSIIIEDIIDLKTDEGMEKLLDIVGEYVDWCWLSMFQNLSENFIERYQNKVDWCNISYYQTLSENFIEKYEDKVDWYWISKYQNLSEKFIEKYEDKVDWWLVSQYQKLSEDFIEKHKKTMFC